MTGHLAHEDMVAFFFGLDEGEARAEAHRHLRGCAECREAMAGLAAREQALIARSATTGSPEGLLTRVWRSRGLPLTLFPTSVLSALIPSWEGTSLPAIAMVAGAAVVAAWLNSLLRRAEIAWRSSRERLQDTLPEAPEDRALFLEGVRLSIVQDLRELRSKLGTVVFISLTVVCFAAIALIAGQLFAPEIAARTMEGFPRLIALAAAMVLLVGSSVWCGLRIRRLALQLLDILEAEARRLISGPA